MRLAPSLIAAVCLSLVGCNKSPAEPAAATSTAPATAAPASPTPSVPASPAPAAELPTIAAAGPLRWTHTAPLVRRAPKSNMRAAEYGVQGDERTELSVFYFGPGQGGNTESNVQRWVGQLEPHAGGKVAVQRTAQDLPGIHVVGVEAEGRFGGGMGMPGMAPPQPIEDALLLGAIAEVASPSGSEPERVYFKLVGPRDAVERARSAFQALIMSLEKGGA